MSRSNSRSNCRIKRLRTLARLLAIGLTFSALAAADDSVPSTASVPYPKYTVGPQPNGSWVVSDGAVITPAGTQVDLGLRVRAKAVALNPNLATHTAAVLTLGTSGSDGNGAVEVFDTQTGFVLQHYITFGYDTSGSYSGITYSADGKYLAFSQDSSWVTVAAVDTKNGLAVRLGLCQRAAGQFLHQLLLQQPSRLLFHTLRHVLEHVDFLSWRRRNLKG